LEAAIKLRQKGHKNVVVVRNGFRDMINVGFAFYRGNELMIKNRGGKITKFKLQ
jgi:hypothetical protein